MAPLRVISYTETMNKKDREPQSELRKMEERILHTMQHHMGALLEHFQSGLSAVAEQYLSLNKKVDALGRQVSTLEEKQDETNQRLNTLEEKQDETLDILRVNQEILIEHDRAIKELQHEKRV